MPKGGKKDPKSEHASKHHNVILSNEYKVVQQKIAQIK